MVICCLNFEYENKIVPLLRVICFGAKNNYFWPKVKILQNCKIEELKSEILRKGDYFHELDEIRVKSAIKSFFCPYSSHYKCRIWVVCILNKIITCVDFNDRIIIY